MIGGYTKIMFCAYLLTPVGLRECKVARNELITASLLLSVFRKFLEGLRTWMGLHHEVPMLYVFVRLLSSAYQAGCSGVLGVR